jgi:hypothetical protein
MQATRKKGQYRRPSQLKSGQIRHTLRGSFNETSTSVISRPQGRGKVAKESVIGTVIYKKANPKTDNIAFFPVLRKIKRPNYRPFSS